MKESLFSPRDVTLALGQLALGAVIGASVGPFVVPSSAPAQDAVGFVGASTLFASALYRSSAKLQKNVKSNWTVSRERHAEWNSEVQRAHRSQGFDLLFLPQMSVGKRRAVALYVERLPCSRIAANERPDALLVLVDRI
jgi:hypothetical protein